MTAEKIIAADNQPQDKFTDELLSDAELDNVAGGNTEKTPPPISISPFGNTDISISPFKTTPPLPLVDLRTVGNLRTVGK